MNDPEPIIRALSNTLACRRPEYGTTSTPARAHASSARTPSSENWPSAPRNSEAPGPSRVPSRSTYRQRTTGATVP